MNRTAAAPAAAADMRHTADLVRELGAGATADALELLAADLDPDDMLLLRRGMHALVDAVCDGYDLEDDCGTAHALAASMMRFVDDTEEGSPALAGDGSNSGCILCTRGTVPNRLNTGLCAYHRLEKLLRVHAAAVAARRTASRPGTSLATPSPKEDHAMPADPATAPTPSRQPSTPSTPPTAPTAPTPSTPSAPSTPPTAPTSPSTSRQ